MTVSDEAKRNRKTAAAHLRKARAAKNPEDRKLQVELAKGYKMLAETDAMLEKERMKSRKKKPREKL